MLFLSASEAMYYSLMFNTACVRALWREREEVVLERYFSQTEEEVTDRGEIDEERM